MVIPGKRAFEERPHTCFIQQIYFFDIFYYCSCAHNMILNLPRSYKVLQIIFILVITVIDTQTYTYNCMYLHVFTCIYYTFYNSCINPTCHTPNDWKLETQALCQAIHLWFRCPGCISWGSDYTYIGAPLANSCCKEILFVGTPTDYGQLACLPYLQITESWKNHPVLKKDG